MNASSPATVIALIAAAIWMWLAMLLTHELGHVVGAMFSGGTIVAVELRPGLLPHTLVEPNPRPGVVLWSGILSGWLAPQMTAPAWRVRAGFIGPVLRAWAAFCLLAGGRVLGGRRRRATHRHGPAPRQRLVALAAHLDRRRRRRARLRETLKRRQSHGESLSRGGAGSPPGSQARVCCTPLSNPRNNVR